MPDQSMTEQIAHMPKQVLKAIVENDAAMPEFRAAAQDILNGLVEVVPEPVTGAPSASVTTESLNQDEPVQKMDKSPEPNVPYTAFIDTGFAGANDPYGIESEYVSQSPHPDASVNQ